MPLATLCKVKALNQKVEKSESPITTHPDQLNLSRTHESSCGFGHVQNFYQIGRIS